MEDETFYFGANKVTDVEFQEEGEGTVRLTLEFPEPIENEDGSRDTAEKVSMPAWEYEVCKTTEPSDLTELRNSKTVYIVDKVYDLFKELDINVADLNFIMDKLLNKFKGTEFQAIWNCLGVQSSQDIRISHYENKL